MAGEADEARPFAGEAIRRVRERRGLSARALSAKAGLSAAYVCRVESGQVEPSFRRFAQLAVVLEMNELEIYTVVLVEGTLEVHEGVA